MSNEFYCICKLVHLIVSPFPKFLVSMTLLFWVMKVHKFTNLPAYRSRASDMHPQLKQSTDITSTILIEETIYIWLE